MFKFFDFFKTKRIDPETFGWHKVFDDDYRKNGYVLRKGATGWLLDKFPKDAPGIICRFGENLTEIDMEEANNFADEVSRPTRRLSSTR